MGGLLGAMLADPEVARAVYRDAKAMRALARVAGGDREADGPEALAGAAMLVEFLHLVRSFLFT